MYSGRHSTPSEILKYFAFCIAQSKAAWKIFLLRIFSYCEEIKNKQTTEKISTYNSKAKYFGFESPSTNTAAGSGSKTSQQTRLQSFPINLCNAKLVFYFHVLTSVFVQFPSHPQPPQKGHVTRTTNEPGSPKQE